MSFLFSTPARILPTLETKSFQPYFSLQPISKKFISLFGKSSSMPKPASWNWLFLDQVQCWTPEWTARITGEGLFLSYRWLEFLFCIVLPWLNSIIFEEFKVMGFDDPFLGTFWQDCTLPIWVGIPLQYPFWSLFDQFMLIQIFYDHNAFGNFGVLFFVPFFFLLPISFSISAYFLFFLMYIVF